MEFVTFKDERDPEMVRKAFLEHLEILKEYVSKCSDKEVLRNVTFNRERYLDDGSFSSPKGNKVNIEIGSVLPEPIYSEALKKTTVVVD